MSFENLAIFTGNSNPELAEKVAKYIGCDLGKARVEQFSDGEIAVQVKQHVRGSDVFIIQPTSAPSHKNLMELLILIDACRRSSAARITAVMPYYGYARQDRRPRNTRVAITAKLVADMVATAGADRVLTMDLHADQIQGFFSIPTDNIYGSPVLLDDMRNLKEESMMVVSPDVGGVVRARASEVMNIIGDVEGRSCILIDDMVDTANTLCHAAVALKQAGAKAVRAYCTHPVLSGPAIERINGSELDEVVVTDTIALSDDAKDSSVNHF